MSGGLGEDVVEARFVQFHPVEPDPRLIEGTDHHGDALGAVAQAHPERALRSGPDVTEGDEYLSGTVTLFIGHGYEQRGGAHLGLEFTWDALADDAAIVDDRDAGGGPAPISAR